MTKKIYKKRRTFLLREDVDKMLNNMVKANDGSTMTSVVEYCIEYVAKRLDRDKKEEDILKRLARIAADVNSIRSFNSYRTFVDCGRNHRSYDEWRAEFEEWQKGLGR